MARQVCIHGHFYQPPREDPWLGSILNEASAAPMRIWNERILKESYLPLAYARRTNGQGQIFEVINCYEWMSFNFGPTIMNWLDRRAEGLVKRIVDADKASLKRLGHGNAVAQIYHHIIMPLASELDKELEVNWSIIDFENRYGRKPEGMWLSECAVNTESLEVLARHGIKFTILAPRQAKAISQIEANNTEWRYINESELDIRFPYLVELPSGKSISVFFYNGPISQAVAFERLLRDGEVFWQRLNNTASEGLLTVGTDGETYGHHFAFGEMALAYVLDQARHNRDDINISNYGRFLADNPARFKVMLHENSSWSCAHGIERWRSNCGCTDGGHGDWSQEWRAPLRACVEGVKSEVDSFFFDKGKAIFKDPKAALLDYGKVLADAQYAPTFLKQHLKKAEFEQQAWYFLFMQEQALASLASCAWFFDDISRLEPLNAMTFSLHAAELLKDLGGKDLIPMMQSELAKAHSNKKEEGSGADIFKNTVLPRRENLASICLQGLSNLLLTGKFFKGAKIDGLRASDAQTTKTNSIAWPYVEVELVSYSFNAATSIVSGVALIRLLHESTGQQISFEWLSPLGVGSTYTETTKLIANKLSIALLNDSFIKVKTAKGETIEFHFKDLAKHKKQSLVLIMLSAMGRGSKKHLLPVALNLVSTLEPWEEAQRDNPSSELWGELAPYIALAAVVAPNISECNRKEASNYIKNLKLEPSELKRIVDLIETSVLEALGLETNEVLSFCGGNSKRAKQTENPPVNLELAETYIDRANALGLNLYWWNVQNRICDLGVHKAELRSLASKLGFVLS